MRRQALEYLACPDCRATVELATPAEEGPDGHVMAGELVCRLGGCRFTIRQGVPMLVPRRVQPLSSDTAARFDEQWKHWRQLHGFYEQQFLDWIAPVRPGDFAGRVVLEGGCGKGRHSAVVSAFGPRALVAVDLGESAFVAFDNTRDLPNVHVVMGDLTQPPVGPVFDLAFSVGVLHHLPDPEAGFRGLSAQVRPGGRVVIWVYGLENNEWITRWVDPVRKAVTARLPPGPLRALSRVPAAALWTAINAVYPLAPGPVRERLPYGEYFTQLRGYPFHEIHNIVFDQLVTPVAYYLPEHEVRRWFQSGFRDVDIRWKGKYSWTGLGTVAGATPAP